MIAPKVFISYTHDSLEYESRILDLSGRLRREGVDCCIDQYEESPAEGWPMWCQRQVAQSTFVLVACTETYLRRFLGHELPKRGLGGTWEGHIVTQELYNAQGINQKFIPITFAPARAQFVPIPLQSATFYELDGAYELLYRRLTGQPLIVRPDLGSMNLKPPQLPAQPALKPKHAFEPSKAAKTQSTTSGGTESPRLLCPLPAFLGDQLSKDMILLDRLEQQMGSAGHFESALSKFLELRSRTVLAFQKAGLSDEAMRIAELSAPTGIQPFSARILYEIRACRRLLTEMMR